MAEHTVEEASEQAVKACRYFAAVLEKNGKGYFAVEVGGVTLVVARGEKGGMLARALEVMNVLGPSTVINRPTPQQTATAPPVEQKAAEPESQNGTGDLSAAASEIVLIPLYHAPPPEHQNKPGHVHLHVLADAKLGRRIRTSGQCLCSKKNGSDERTLNGETDMCAECVKIAAENGIAWSLT